MIERDDVLGALRAAGVLEGIRWAYGAACSATLSHYDEADGHDAALFGTMRHTLFKDRLDRVFSCGKYVASTGDAGGGVDLVLARLSPDEIRSFPQIDPSLVARGGLQGSPGWVHDERRYLLASSPFGEVDRLPWPRKSPVKQRVASQRTTDPEQSLFDELDDDEIGSLSVLADPTLELDLPTFVIAHSLASMTGQRELILGRAKFNAGGGAAWRWSADVLGGGPSGRGSRTDAGPGPVKPDVEPDAPVTLRRSAAPAATNVGGGQ